jgi:hypothetical protein
MLISLPNNHSFVKKVALKQCNPQCLRGMRVTLFPVTNPAQARYSYNSLLETSLRDNDPARV